MCIYFTTLKCLVNSSVELGKSQTQERNLRATFLSSQEIRHNDGYKIPPKETNRSESIFKIINDRMDYYLII